MKKVLFLMVLSLSTVLFAQDVTVGSTEELTNDPQFGNWTGVLGQDQTGYYLLRKEGSISNQKIFLEKYSPDLKPLYTSDITVNPGVLGNSMFNRFTEISKGQIYVFIDGWEKAKSTGSLYVRRVDNESGKLETETVLLEAETAKNQLKSANYSISFSPDGSKLLVLTQKPFTKKENESLRLQVFNTTGFSSVWKQDLTLDNLSDRAPQNQIIVDNDGVAHFFKDVKISFKEHYYQLYTVGADFVNKQAIDFGSYMLGQAKLFMDPANNVVVNGTVIPINGNDTDWNGLFYVKANNKGELLHNKIEPLGADLLQQVVNEKKANNESYVLKNYGIKDVIQNPAGGHILLVEERYQTQKNISQTPLTYQYTITHGNAFAIAYDANGARLWNTAIIKHQQETTLDPDNVFGSFAYQLKDNKLYVIWNYTQILTDPPFNKFRYWVDRNGSKINIDNTFGKRALYPTLLTTIDEHGALGYTDRTFDALPLEAIQKNNAFVMATDPHLFLETDKGMVILSRMPGEFSKRYKWNTISF